MPPRSTLHYAAAAAVVGLLALPATGFAPGPRTAPALLAPSLPACAAPRCHRDAGRGRRRLMMSTAAVPPEPGFMAKVSEAVEDSGSASERKKLIPLALMFFCILFNYTILRDTKDVLVVTARGSGAEVIPFIKTYLMLPSGVGALHPHLFVDKLAATLPAGFSAPLSLVRNWIFALFYVAAEMWGSVVASLLFWSFANKVTTVDEAKKYYPSSASGPTLPSSSPASASASSPPCARTSPPASTPGACRSSTSWAWSARPAGASSPSSPTFSATS